MKRLAKYLLKDDRGAVTVDWVVLTAAIVGLNVAGIIAYIEGGLEIGGNAILSSILEAKDQ